MKLLLILCIEEHGNDIRKLLAKCGCPVYSETDIHGFKTDSDVPDLSNWFAHNPQGTFSKLFFSIQAEEKVSSMLQAIKAFNEKDSETSNYPVHAYQLSIENHV